MKFLKDDAAVAVNQLDVGIGQPVCAMQVYVQKDSVYGVSTCRRHNFTNIGRNRMKIGSIESV